MTVSAQTSSRYGTSMPHVVGGAVAAVIALIIILSIDVTWVTETFGYDKRTDARVPMLPLPVFPLTPAVR